MPSIAIPVSLRGQLLAGTGFNPASLFAVSGSRGFMYDLSDYSSQFQDTAGTTPITATSQSVGLVLDKSQGLALGSELVTNGDFSNGLTGWTDASTAPSTIVVVNGVATWQTDGVNNGRLRQSFTTVVGRTYRVTATGFITTVAIGTTSGGQEIVSFAAVNSRPSFVFTATTTTTWLNTVTNTNGATLDNVSVKELAGNHATQSTAGNRALTVVFPSSGVRNRANGSADVGNTAIWSSTFVSNGITHTVVARGVGADGLPYIDMSVVGTASANAFYQPYLRTQSEVVAKVNDIFTSSALVQIISGTAPPAGSGLRALVFGFTAPSTQTQLTGSSAIAPTTEQLLSHSATITVAGTDRAQGTVDITTLSGVTVNYTVRIKALQFELGSSRTNYQFNYSAQNVTEVPFASIRGIQFDGVDDWLQTAAVDFSNSDEVTVVAGVRKLSDAAQGIVVELTNATTNRFSLSAPTGATANFGFVSGGSTLAFPSSAPSFASPNTAVLTGQGKISTDLATLNRNGTQIASVATDQGTGNFSNAIVYIGRRGGASLPLNGVLTFLFAINRLLTANELAAVEQFANSRTGAF